MSVDSDVGIPGEDHGSNGGDPPAAGDLSDRDRVLRAWANGAVAIDPRYGSKGLLKLVALAMRGGDFRSRLVDDTAAVLAELPSLDDLPGVTLRFFDNTPYVLNVVLPPVDGGVTGRSRAFRERLRSRTAEFSFAEDDWDIGDPTDPVFNGVGNPDQGDPDTHDVPIVDIA